MIVDVRTYHVKPGKMPQELDLYDKHGFAPQVRVIWDPHSPICIGESGDINTLACLTPGLRGSIMDITHLSGLSRIGHFFQQFRRLA